MRSRLAGDAPGLALRLLLLQRVDQIDGRVEAHPLAVTRDAGHADGGRQMRLARARSADQNDVVRRLGERQLGQLHGPACDPPARPSKSKPARSRCTGNFAAFIWWLDRAHRTIRRLGLQQVLEQPARASSLGAAPCSTSSAQAPAMPCRRNALSSTMTSRMADLLGCCHWRAACRSAPCRPAAASATCSAVSTLRRRRRARSAAPAR